jgi:hypothetical protein
MIKNITIIVLALLLAASTYYLGYMTGARREVLRSDARFRVSVYDALYHSAEEGDLQKIRSTVSILLLGAVRSYQYEFGDETGTNSFAMRYADARMIADHVESTLVPISSITNHLPPGMKLQIDKDKQ